MSRSRKADTILQALLTNRTIREAAAAAQVSERIVYSYLADPAFEARYKAARHDIIRGVSNNLREQMNEAVDVIGDIMRSPGNRPQDRLAAAKVILEFGDRFIENIDILERISNLERTMNNEHSDG